MTPHPHCKRWVHRWYARPILERLPFFSRLITDCHQCDMRREVDAIQEDAHREFMRLHFPESYRRFNRPALKVVRGGE